MKLVSVKSKKILNANIFCISDDILRTKRIVPFLRTELSNPKYAKTYARRAPFMWRSGSSLCDESDASFPGTKYQNLIRNRKMTLLS
jgi:hypothetical protein